MPLLHQAIQQHHTRQVELLTANGINVNQRDPRKRTPLHLVCDIDNQSLAVRYAKILLDLGANIRCKDDQGLTAFCYACIKERIPLVRMILKKREVDYLEADKEGNTPLHHAAAVGNISLVYGLVRDMCKCGVGVDAINNHGETAMMLAAKYGHDVCETILRKDGKASGTIRDMRNYRTVKEWKDLAVVSKEIKVSPRFRAKFPEVCKNLIADVPPKASNPMSTKSDSKDSLPSIDVTNSISSAQGISIKQTFPAIFDTYKDQIATSYRTPAQHQSRRLSHLQDNDRNADDWLTIEGSLFKSRSCGSISDMKLYKIEWGERPPFYKIVIDLTFSRRQMTVRESKTGRSVKDVEGASINLSRGYTFPTSRKDS